MKRKLLVIWLLTLSFASFSYSQFYKVYGYKTRAKKEAELVFWNTYIVQSDLQYSFFALYLDFEDPAGESLSNYIFQR